MTTIHHGHPHSHSHSPARSVEASAFPIGLSSQVGANQRQMRKETPNGLRAHGHSHSYPVEYHDRHDHDHHDPNHRHYNSNTQIPRQYFPIPLNGNNDFKRMPISIEPPVAKAYSDSNEYGFPSTVGTLSPPGISTTAHGTSERSSRPWLSAQEALNSIILPLPLLLTTLAFSSHSPESNLAPAEPAFAHLTKSASGNDSPRHNTIPQRHTSPGFAEACALASATLLLVGSIGKIYYKDSSLDRRKDNLGIGGHHQKKPVMILSANGAERIARRAFGVGLPFYAALKLSGDRTAMILLTVLAGALSRSDGSSGNVTSVEGWKRLLSTRRYVVGVLLVGIACDMLGYTMSVDFVSLVLGYTTLIISTVFLPLPFRSSVSAASPISPLVPSATSTSAVPATPWGQPPELRSPLRLINAVSPFISTAQNTNITLVTSVILFILSSVAHLLSLSSNLQYSALHWILFIAAAAAAALMLILAQPSSLQTEKKAGFILGITFTSVLSIVSLGDSWLEGTIQSILGILSYLAIQIDTPSFPAHNSDKKHRHYNHQHGGKPSGGGHDHAHRSMATKTLLHMTQQWPLAHSILIEKDSRRIFYFMILNFSFMLVQTFYGIATGSLGLLSDSIHMLFDCLALIVGLCAAVMSKWPPSVHFPYGLGKMDTLAGFANGIFLMLISVEIVTEAIERLVEGSEMKRIGELLTVSSLGLVVNLVGLFAFDHAHHGHGHSHGGHSHGYSHSHSHGADDHHDHDHDYGSHEHGHSHGSPSKSRSHGHGHHHSNENMHGIFLHVLADTLGSVAVVISTLLIKWFGWSGFDPLASCLIAILIFASAIPLVASSAKTLLLTIPADTEYHLRETLAGVSGLRGVAGYCVPRFWLEDATGAADAHSPSCDANSKGNDGPKVLGMIHVIVSKGADLDEAKSRVVTFLNNNGLDVVVQVEREGEGRCWCGGGNSKMGGS